MKKTYENPAVSVITLNADEDILAVSEEVDTDVYDLYNEQEQWEKYRSNTQE